MSHSFALIGAAGFVAPRHLDAVNSVGGNLVLSLDINDSVGVLDSYFPECEFYSRLEEFEARLEDIQKQKELMIQWMSICTPNYLHASHIRLGLRHGCDVICEKPAVLDLDELTQVTEIAADSGSNIYTILQLRLHKDIVTLKNKYEKSKNIEDVELTYITSRGHWYHQSWKGDDTKSGGLAANIGIHFFDMLCWIFGDQISTEIFIRNSTTISGLTKLERANVKWFLSVDRESLPTEAVLSGKTTFRSIKVGSSEVEFSSGFKDLHNESYRRILAGKGIPIEESRAAIEITSDIRFLPVISANENVHPFMRDL